MKKPSLFIIALFTIGGFWSCSNEDNYDVPEPKEKDSQAVTFKIIGFESEVVPFKKSLKAGESNAVDGLRYYIWSQEDYSMVTGNPLEDPMGNTVKPNQDGTFSFTETLPVGKYYMSIIAASNIENIGIHQEVVEMPGWGLFHYPNSGISSSKLDSDIFGKTFEIEVGGEGTNSIENIVLPRIVGKVEVIIKDAKLAPAGVKNIQLYHHPEITANWSSMNYLPTAWMFKGEKTLLDQGIGGQEFVFPTISRNEMLQADEIKYSLYMFPTSNIWNYEEIDEPGEYEGTLSSLRIKIDGVSSKVITKNLKVYRNKVTRYSGNIFSDDPSFNVQVGEEWGDIIDEEF